MFRHKEYVLTIIKEGGFTKAAEKLYVSQPSLSATVKRLEDKIGVPIFDRSSSPISLTEAGKEYVKYALEIEQKERDFERYVSDYSNLLTGTIRIGGSSLFSSFILPKMISEFNASYPQIEFEIFEDSTKNLMQKLNFGELDVVIDNARIDNENITSKVYTSEILLLAVPKFFAINDKISTHRLSAGDVKRGKHLSTSVSVPLKTFENEAFIFLNPENDTGIRAVKLFKKHELTPKVSFTLDQQVTSYNVSCSGLGISFVSDTLIKHVATSPDLYFYRLSDSEVVRNIYFYRKSNKYLSLACKTFIEYNFGTDKI